MRYLQLKNRFSAFNVLSIQDIRKVWPKFDSRRLVEWQEKGYLKKIIKGYYIFADTQLNEQGLFLIANTIYQPSYISLESALSYYNIIPEGVYTVTSITTKKTQQFETSVGAFSYQSIKPNLNSGYVLKNYQNQKFKIAELEKAILDYLYLHSELDDETQFEGLRFSQDELNRALDKQKMNEYLNIFGTKALSSRVDIFFKYLQTSEISIDSF